MFGGRKIALTLLTVLVIIFVGLAILIPRLFDIDHYRPQVAVQIQQDTGKPAQIGHLALTIVPRVAIRVDDFSLGNPAGFPAGDFVKAKKIYAVVNASALLRRHVEITSLELDDLALNMLEDTHGKWNFENPPAKNPPPPAAPPGSSGSSFTLGIISRLTIVRGEFTAANLLASGLPGPTLMAVHGVSIGLRQVNLNAFTAASPRWPASAPSELADFSGWPNTVVYAADAEGPVVAQGNIKADALTLGLVAVTGLKSKFRLFPKQVFFEDLDLKCYGGGATGNFSLDFGGANLAYGVDARFKGVNVGEFLAAYPQTRGMMTGTFEGSAKLHGLVNHAADPLAGVTGSGQASIRNGQMPSLQLNSNLRTVARMAGVGPANGDPSAFSSLATDFRIADARLVSNKIRLVGNGVDVNGSGSMTLASEGTLDYQGDASLAASGNNPLIGILTGLAGAKFAHGKITFPFRVGGTFAQPRFSLKGGASETAAAPSNADEQDVNTLRGVAGIFKKKKEP